LRAPVFSSKKKKTFLLASALNERGGGALPFEQAGNNKELPEILNNFRFIF
jgi:hypothetical protein